jgi:hypothetical protein
VEQPSLPAIVVGSAIASLPYSYAVPGGSESGFARNNLRRRVIARLALMSG